MFVSLVLLIALINTVHAESETILFESWQFYSKIGSHIGIPMYLLQLKSNIIKLSNHILVSNLTKQYFKVKINSQTYTRGMKTTFPQKLAAKFLIKKNRSC